MRSSNFQCAQVKHHAASHSASPELEEVMLHHAASHSSATPDLKDELPHHAASHSTSPHRNVARASRTHDIAPNASFQVPFQQRIHVTIQLGGGEDGALYIRVAGVVGVA